VIGDLRLKTKSKTFNAHGTPGQAEEQRQQGKLTGQ
jgi:hypothetical protein